MDVNYPFDSYYSLIHPIFSITVTTISGSKVHKQTNKHLTNLIGLNGGNAAYNFQFMLYA